MNDNNNKMLLIKNKISFNGMNNNIRYSSSNNNNNIAKSLNKNVEDKITENIINKLKKTESELTNDLNKIIQNEKMMKDESYILLINKNGNNLNLVKNKLNFDLKEINKNKNMCLDRLNEVKNRINTLEYKYIKNNGVYDHYCKTNLKNFLEKKNSVNSMEIIKSNLKIKKLQKENDILLSNMKSEVNNLLEEKKHKFEEEKKLQMENNLKNQKEKIEKMKDEHRQKKNYFDEEMKKLEGYINKKPITKIYLYQKIIKDEKEVFKKNKKRKIKMKSIDNESMNEDMKNYEINKIKKKLELQAKTKKLKKSWSERELLIPEYKSPIVNILNEEEKNKKKENDFLKEQKNKMKNKQIIYSKKYENEQISLRKNNYIINNKRASNDNIASKIKYNNISNYSNLIRNNLLNKSHNKRRQSLNKNTKNNLLLPSGINSDNHIKLPNLIFNSKSNKINNNSAEKNNKNINTKEIKNLIEKNGFNDETFELANIKLNNLKHKKEQKDLLLKYQGGMAANPDLGDEVCDILIDSMKAKLSLIDEYKKAKNGKIMVDKGSGDNEIDYDENEEEEEYENEEEND